MKLLLALSLLGLAFPTASRPLLAQADLPSIPWGAELGLYGVFGGLLFYAMAKLIPQISQDNKETQIRVAAENKEAAVRVAEIHASAYREVGDKMDQVGTQLEGVRAEIRAGNDSQLALLRNVLSKSQA